MLSGYILELALAISLISLGSSQTLRLPHFITEAESLFCRRRLLRIKHQLVNTENHFNRLNEKYSSKLKNEHVTITAMIA